MSGDERVRDPGNDHAWLNETSDDGDTWSQEHHPVHGTRDSGGVSTRRNKDGTAVRYLQSTHNEWTRSPP